MLHPSAIVDDGATIGSGTKIWHFSHVMSGAVIGRDCSLGQNVFVANKVVIGNNVKIQNNVSVYDNVTLEDDVFCGPSMVFTNVYNPRSHVSRKDEYRDTLVQRGATLGANCTIVCGVTIGQYAFVAAGAVVNRNVPAYALVAGVPARQIGWMSQQGERLKLPLQGTAEATCPATGQRYRLNGTTLTSDLRPPTFDSEVLSVHDSGEGLDDYALQLQAELDAIRNAPLPADADQPPLSAEQQARFEAFQLREDR